MVSGLSEPLLIQPRSASHRFSGSGFSISPALIRRAVVRAGQDQERLVSARAISAS